MLTDGVVSKLLNTTLKSCFLCFIYLKKKTKGDFRNINHTEIKQVLSFKQVSVTLSNFLNRKIKKQEKNRFQNLPSMCMH